MRRVFPGMDMERDLREFHQGVAELVRQFQRRIAVVEEGYEVCRRENCAPGTQNWEDWSTPSRDARIREAISQLSSLMELSSDSRLYDEWYDAAGRVIFSIAGRPDVTLGQLAAIFHEERFSSDPADPVAERWGLQED